MQYYIIRNFVLILYISVTCVQCNKIPQIKKKNKNDVVSINDYNSIHDNNNSINKLKYNKIIPKPKTKNQEEYINYLEDPSVNIVAAIGSAGTGKTFFACHAAVKALHDNIIDKIIISRPIISVSNENIGYLPGELKDKMNPWMLPIYDVFLQYYTQKEITKKIEDGIIVISPLGYMRGRTFNNCYIILDESQNTTPEQLLMIMTRIGYNCKLIITGDLYQSDLCIRNGLYDFIEKTDNYLQSYDPIRIIKFNTEDVQRSSAVKSILRLYKCT